MNDIRRHVSHVTRAAFAGLALLLALPASAAPRKVSDLVKDAVCAAVRTNTPVSPAAREDAVVPELDAMMRWVANATGPELMRRNDATAQTGPAIALEDQGERYVVHVKDPNLREDAVGVVVDDHRVTISIASEQEEDEIDADGAVRLHEVSARETVRTIALAEAVEVSRMSTSSADGEFTIVLPKATGASKE